MTILRITFLLGYLFAMTACFETESVSFSSNPSLATEANDDAPAAEEVAELDASPLPTFIEIMVPVASNIGGNNQQAPQVKLCSEIATGEDVGYCIALRDSFERDEILEANGAGFQWANIIDDLNGGNGYRVDAQINDQDMLGPVHDSIIKDDDDKKRTLTFSGRPGGSVHSLFLISKPLNLTDFAKLELSFQYLPVGLEMFSYKNFSGMENIKVEICTASLNECGVGANVNVANLNGDKWQEVYKSEDFAGENLNGHNHILEDWIDAKVEIDLSQLGAEAKGEFVFRFNVILDEGFKEYAGGEPVVDSDMEDGVLLHNIEAIAKKENVLKTQPVSDIAGI